MFLDDASPQASIFPDPSAPSGSESKTGYILKPEAIVRPDAITMYLGFFGPKNWHDILMERTQLALKNMKVTVQRPPTQSEVDATVQLISYSTYLSRVGLPYSFLLSSAWQLAQSRRSVLLMHAYVSRERLTSHPTGPLTLQQVFAGMQHLAKSDFGIFRQAAIAAGGKIVVYTMAGWMFSTLFANSIAGSRAAADPRLREYKAEAKEQDPLELRQRKLDAAVKEAERRRRKRLGESTAGLEEGENNELNAGDVGSFSGIGSGSGSGSVSPSPSPPLPRDPSPITQRNNSRTGGFFDEDDASPTAPEFRGGGNSASQGSVWEQIRQQNRSQVSSPSGGLRPSSSEQVKPDSWPSAGVAGAASDSQREREQAQAEFDRLLEAERNLSGDSAETADKQGGWRRW